MSATELVEALFKERSADVIHRGPYPNLKHTFAQLGVRREACERIRRACEKEGCVRSVQQQVWSQGQMVNTRNHRVIYGELPTSDGTGLWYMESSAPGYYRLTIRRTPS